MYLQDDPIFCFPWNWSMDFNSAWYLSMVYDPFSFQGIWSFFGENWRFVAINAHLPYIYEGRNNDVLDQFNCEGQLGGKYGGNMMYVYGLDHGELGEHFLVLTYFPLMCEGRSSSYG